MYTLLGKFYFKRTLTVKIVDPPNVLHYNQHQTDIPTIGLTETLTYRHSDFINSLPNVIFGRIILLSHLLLPHETVTRMRALDLVANTRMTV